MKLFSANIFFTFLCIGLFSYSHIAFGESGLSQSLSVTPPLFQISANPGDIWQSSIKVVNGNPYPLTVYTEVVNFSPVGEAGQGKFTPILKDESGTSSLAHWIHTTDGPQVIDPEQSKDISFYAEIPKDAPPGGHYAAILVSTQPPQKGSGNLSVLTSQAVSSLFFLRIEGDVVEDGTIREFSMPHSFLEKPEAEFSLRFENKGNVHLQPRGNIIITNMWGTERGKIPVNYQSHFGNVLPKSIRDFKFTWQSDFNITDIGLYKAEVTLAYGESGVKSANAVTYFWVIPVKATLISIAVVALFVWLIVLMVRAYVRRMLMLAGVDVDAVKKKEKEEVPEEEFEKPKSKVSYRAVSAPLRDGVIDLRQRLSRKDEFFDVFKIVWQFIQSYKTFFVSVCVLVIIFITAVLYFSKVTEERHNYKVIIDEGDKKTTLDASKGSVK